MRPRSIRTFEIVYLISILLVLVQQVLAFFATRGMFDNFAVDGNFSNGGFEGFLIFGTLFGVIMACGVPLLFWWLAARKRQEFAKWVLLALSVLSVLNWILALIILTLLPTELMTFPGLASFGALQTAGVVVDLVAETVGVIALAYLFRADAVAWFRNAHPTAHADVFR